MEVGSAEAILKWRQCRTSLYAEKPKLINFFFNLQNSQQSHQHHQQNNQPVKPPSSRGSHSSDTSSAYSGSDTMQVRIEFLHKN